MGRDIEIHREPCPHRIIDDSGSSFAMGALGGSTFHFLKGIYNSPKGFRLVGGSQAVSIISGAATGGFLNLRNGLGSSASATALGVFLLTHIEGSAIVVNNLVNGLQPHTIIGEGQGPPAANLARLLTHHSEFEVD